MQILASGKDANVPIPDVLETLEKWVVIAYGGNKCPSTIKTIPELRWYMFAKFQSDVSTLPPTVAALKYKIYRSHYVALVLRKSLSSIQNLPSPLDFGWERSDDAYKPIMTDKLPAPVALIELSVCSCTTKCVNNRCKCRKNKLQCTDMCKCIDCDNDDTFEDSEDENEFTSDDDDD